MIDGVAVAAGRVVSPQHNTDAFADEVAPTNNSVGGGGGAEAMPGIAMRVRVAGVAGRVVSPQDVAVAVAVEIVNPGVIGDRPRARITHQVPADHIHGLNIAAGDDIG